MATINLAHVMLTCNASALANGFKIMRGEVASVRRALKDGQSETDQYNNQLLIIQKYLAKGSKTAAEYAQAMEGLNKRFKQGKYSEAGIEAAAKLKKDADKAKADAQKRSDDYQARTNELIDRATSNAMKYRNEIQELQNRLARKNITQAQYNVLLDQSAKRMGFVTDRMRVNAGLQNQLDRAQKRVNTGLELYKRVMDNAMSAQQRHLREQVALRSAYKANQISADAYRHALILLKKEQGQEGKKGGSEFLGMVSGKLGTILGVTALGKMVKDARDIAAGIETTTLAFDVMTGSAEKAKNMVAELRKLDAKTPISFQGLADGAKTLMGYGMEASRITPTLQRLSDISLGNEEKFKSLALAFGQVKAAGRLMGQETLQMVNAGFNPLQEIAGQMAKTYGGLAEEYMPKLKKAMEDGKISFEMFEQSVGRATSAGGRFFGATERSIETSAGQWAKFVSDLQTVQIAFGEAIGPAAMEMVTSLGNLLKDFADSPTLALITTAFEGWGAVFATMNGNLYEYLDKLDATHAKAKIAYDARMKHEEEYYAFRIKNVDLSENEAKKQFELLGKKKEALEQDKMLLPEMGLSKAEQEAAKLEARNEKREHREYLHEVEKIEEKAREREMGKHESKLAEFMDLKSKTELNWVEQMRFEKALKDLKLNQEDEIAKKKQKDADALIKKEEAAILALVQKFDEASPLAKMQETFDLIGKASLHGLKVEDADFARREAAAKYLKKDNRFSGLDAYSAPSIQAGSVEAYKHKLEQEAKAAEALKLDQVVAAEMKRRDEIAAEAAENAKAMIQLTEEQKRILERIENALRDQAPVISI